MTAKKCTRIRSSEGYRPPQASLAKWPYQRWKASRSMARKVEEYVVIGLGRFGSSTALRLMELGQSVLGIDRDRELVQELSDNLTQTLALDASDEEALRAAGVAEFDTAIVAIGQDFESNVLITSLLKEIGLRTVICKALSRRQRQILLRVGADQVLLPEEEAGVRLAERLRMPLVLDRLEIEPGVSITELRCPHSFAGHSLRELGLERRFGISVLAIKGSRVRVSPSEDEVLRGDDALIVIGSDTAIAGLHDRER
jgi:trk system potassium uptake protein